jgi:hypothetical protein
VTLAPYDAGVSEIWVVHLVWAPLPVELVQRFAASLSAHPAGREHRLLAVYNGFDGADDPRLAPRRAALAEHAPQELVLGEPVLDLAAYRAAAVHAQAAAALCFCNSFSRVLADGWLERLGAALAQPGTGMVGAAGSWESTYSSAPPWVKPRRREFPRFPNPHLRTNAFLLARDLLLDLDWPPATGKREALRLEGGARSLSRQIWERSLEVLVVGRDGTRHRAAQWPASATFRSGEQENLLVADNRTDQYAQASPRRRRRLARMAWGRARAASSLTPPCTSAST